MASTRSYHREERVRGAHFEQFGNAERFGYAEQTAAPVRYRQSIPHPRIEYVGPAEETADRWRGSGADLYEVGVAPSRAAHRRRRGRRRARRTSRTTTVLMAMSAVAVAVGGVAAATGGLPAIRPSATVDAAFEKRSSLPEAASRGEIRAAPASSAPPSSSAPAQPAPKTSASTRTTTAPRKVEPMAGLNQTQMNNAATIIEVGRERDLPRRAILVALMTGLQESSLRNLANPTVPASLDRPHEGQADDFDSLGLFQQRPSQGWGSVRQLMDPRYAARTFYERLVEVDDWEEKSLADAAQAVQRSAFPDAYAKHEDRATEVVDALL